MGNHLSELENLIEEEEASLLNEREYRDESNIEVLAEGFGRKFVKDTENDYYYTKTGNGVAVLLKEGDSYIFLKQFRPPVNSTTLELIYGKVGEGEDNLVSAIKEVKYGTGYSLKWIRKIGNFYASPSNLSEEFTIFIAEVDDEKHNSLTEDDEIKDRIVRLSRNDILEKIGTGELLLSSLAIAVLFDILINRK